MMIEFGNGLLMSSAFAVLAGMLLGAFYFVGLWLTVRQLGASQYVALLFLVSMLFRSSVVIAGFYFILGNDWRPLLLGLLGFMVSRWCSARIIRGKADPHSSPESTLTLKQKKPYAP